MKEANIYRAQRLAHEFNRAYCEHLNDYSQLSWEQAPEWQVESCINGVMYKLENPNSTPAQQHQNWLDVKERDGWVYGEVKDTEKKTHPCFVPYEQLPESQKIKDEIFQMAVDIQKRLEEAEV